MANVIRSAATCCVALNTSLSGIDAERDSRNDAADFMPPVLPHQIVQLRSQDFADIIRKQKDHLSDRRSQQSIVLNQCDVNTTFENGWYHVQHQFEHLKTFCGGLATAFPCTSTVESDFSVFKWEKDDCRIGLTDFSLEGILHTKQFETLQ
uniref:Uncharacterized protein n=1 Tax=Hyaloperonospora arabidopsidis (strain Emoy2) TaxID=559515 RepID=M4BTW7_HYAAE